MDAQSTFLAALRTFADIANEVDLDAGLAATANAFAPAIRDFRVLVPVVGSFNAGKTSLINVWLGRNEGVGLPTDIVPQTALATEIYSVADEENERVDLFGDDNKVLQQVDLAAFAAFEKDAVASGQSDARYAKAMLRVGRLTPGSRRVLVDMPGLDSGLRNHNAAIQRYLPLGSYFILVVDIEHGALRESEILQLREFLDQDVEFTVLVNKAEKKTIAARDEIVRHIKTQVSGAFGKAAPVAAVSALNEDIAGFENAVNSADFERALRNYWRRRLFSTFDEAIVSLHTRYSAINVSSVEGDRFIRELQRKRRALEVKLGEDQRDIQKMYGDRAIDRIVREVRNEICESASSLASSMQTGGRAAFDTAINELVRSDLNRALSSAEAETRQRIGERYQADIDSLNDELDQFVGNAEDLRSRTISAGEVSANIQRAAGQMPTAFRNASDRLSSSRGRGAYQTIVGVAAATTDIVAPWMEVVFIVMPLIVDGIKRWMHGREILEKHQKLRIHIASNIAPKIATTLRGEIREEYEKLAKGMLSDLRDGVKRQVDRIEADIQKSRDEIDRERTDSDARKAQLLEAVNRLTEARERIERV
ncbi:MAG: dynamin family protein [Chloroflexi bacterium]|nr:dynamin family protein [Chloroflexota bacterium]